MNGPQLLEVSGLSVRYGGVRALQDVSLTVDRGQIAGLIGPNGAGKTTMIDALTGFARATGTVKFAGVRLDGLSPHRRAREGLVRTFQSLELFEDLSVGENLAAAVPRRHRASHGHIVEVASSLGISEVLNRLPSTLSHGERKRVAICRSVLSGADLLLLDEPAAGLDTWESHQLGQQLRRLSASGITILLVDHDMSLVLDVCDAIHVLDRGQLIASGTPDDIRADHGVVEAYLGSDGGDEAHRDDASSSNSLRPQSGATVAASRSLAQAGVNAIEVTALSAGYKGLPVVHDLTLSVSAGQVVALLGPNGAGKSTTLSTISGLLSPLGGTMAVLGRAVPHARPHLAARRGVAYVAEDRSIFRQLTVEENLRLGSRGGRSDLRAAVNYFPVLEPLMRRRAGLLSGGEQQMLSIARALVSRPDVLMIDELSLGLAPIVVAQLLQTVRRFAEESGAAVLLVEQHVHQVLRVCDYAYVLTHGQLVLEGHAVELRQRQDLIRASYLGHETAVAAPGAPALRQTGADASSALGPVGREAEK